MIFTTYNQSDTYYEFVGENGQKLIYPVSSIILTDDESGFIAVKNTASRQIIGLLAKPIPPFSGKFKLTLSDSSTVSAECDSTSAVTREEVSSQYSRTVVSAEIGQCVTNIGNYTFANCKSLQSITCLATTPATLGGLYTFYGTNNCPIYVPCDSVSAYQSAWGGIVDASRITAIV